MGDRENKEYREERFDFALYVNDNLICKRNFRIYNFIEHSMETIDFKEVIDSIVRMIDEDLKSKSRVYTWYQFNPMFEDETDEFHTEPAKEGEYMFKFVVYDNKRPIIQKAWDGWGYPQYVRRRVDVTNKNVYLVSKDGSQRVYDKNRFFGNREGNMSVDMEMIKAMIMDKSDLSYVIQRRICDACSVARNDFKDEARFDRRNYEKYLEGYETKAEFDNGSGKTVYDLNLSKINRTVEKGWDKKLQRKTREYLKTIY